MQKSLCEKWPTTEKTPYLDTFHVVNYSELTLKTLD